MTDCWLTFGYACGLFIGGLLGLNHDDPNISMGMGLLNAVGATYGAYLIHENPNDIKVTAFIATFNAIFLGLKAAKSQSTNTFLSCWNSNLVVIGTIFQNCSLIKLKMQHHPFNK